MLFRSPERRIRIPQRIFEIGRYGSYQLGRLRINLFRTRKWKQHNACFHLRFFYSTTSVQIHENTSLVLNDHDTNKAYYPRFITFNRAGPDSRDHLDTFLGKDLKGRDYVVEVAGSLSVSDGEWKYIAPSNGAAYAKLTNIELGNSKEEQLYNLKQDIGEKKNLAAEHPEIVAKLKAILEKEKAK